jgi:hypothetical protein
LALDVLAARRRRLVAWGRGLLHSKGSAANVGIFARKDRASHGLGHPGHRCGGWLGLGLGGRGLGGVLGRGNGCWSLGGLGELGRLLVGGLRQGLAGNRTVWGLVGLRLGVPGASRNLGCR